MSTDQIVSYRDALATVMKNALKDHDHTIILGQGVDDHKGTFGSTLGLHKEFGAHRVFDTPLAEDSVAGVAIGAAMNGMYPINTHIRADFSILAMNQVVNHAAKYRYMSGGKHEVPMMMRLVVGRSWGQGAQHSQSFQSLFAHIPGLTVVMPAHADTILDTYPYLVANYKNPVVMIEHRLMYDLKFKLGEATSTEYKKNPLQARVVRKGKDVTIVATSIMVLEAHRAAEHLYKTKGIDCEIIDLHTPSHYDPKIVLESLKKTGKLIVADTSWIPYGTSAEICRIVCENSPQLLKAPVVTLGMAQAPCPTAKSLEDLYYPNLKILADKIAVLVTGKKDHGIPLPDEVSMADVYKKFKGPF